MKYKYTLFYAGIFWFIVGIVSFNYTLNNGYIFLSGYGFGLFALSILDILKYFNKNNKDGG